MDIRQLEYFVTVADELHFGRAAERLHIVQSAVSQQIRRLERQLSLDLFDRTTRSVHLTEAGRLLLPHAREILAARTRALAAMDELGAQSARTLRLGTSTGLGTRLDAVHAAFARLAPDASLELVSVPAADRLAQVRSGELAAAIVRGGAHAPGLELLPLWEDELVAALPARHELAVRATVPMAELAALPLRIAARERNPELFDLMTECCRRAGFEPQLEAAFTNDQDTLSAIAFGRPAWTVYYASMAPRLPVASVVFRPLRDPVPAMATSLAVRPDPPGAALRALIEACHEAAG